MHYGKRPTMRFAETRNIRPVSEPQPIFPLLCGMCVTAIVTLGIDASPMISTMLGVVAGAFAVFGCTLALKKFG